MKFKHTEAVFVMVIKTVIKQALNLSGWDFPAILVAREILEVLEEATLLIKEGMQLV
ncbi:hypothetical protein [Enterovibrio norvegicus]|uniref:hypothetical protein n=1 Tax=Enterovibrio norvegicus TaxID=188144 RepID=UPI000362F190|nr:hypothetical protein [Enterovibrio norvegicus]